MDALPVFSDEDDQYPDEDEAQEAFTSQLEKGIAREAAVNHNRVHFDNLDTAADKSYWREDLDAQQGLCRGD